jgi:hypothetical protein
MVNKIQRILFNNMPPMDKVKGIKRIIQVQGPEALLQNRKREKIAAIQIIQKVQEKVKKI